MMGARNLVRRAWAARAVRAAEKRSAMPYFEHMGPTQRRIGRGAHVLGYFVAAVIVGGGGLSYPPGQSVDGLALGAARGAGLVILLAGLLAAWAHASERWLVEFEALPALGVGLTVYAIMVVVHTDGPREDPWSLILFGLIVMALCGMVARSVHLTAKVENHTEAQERAQGGG